MDNEGKVVTFDAYKLYGEDESRRSYDSNGWLNIKDNPFVKAGVFNYLGSEIGQSDDKIYRVYRPLSEIEASLDTMRNKPIIINHRWLSGDSKEGAQVGSVGSNVSTKGNYGYVDLLTLTDKGAIDGVLSGEIAELSPGFKAKYEIKSGEYQGQPYDLIQRDIAYNHLALVDKGRNGRDIRVLDSASNPNKEANMDRGFIAKLQDKLKGKIKGYDAALEIIDEAIKDNNNNYGTIKPKASDLALSDTKGDNMTLTDILNQGCSKVAAAKDDERKDIIAEVAEALKDEFEGNRAKYADDDLTKALEALKAAGGEQTSDADIGEQVQALTEQVASLAKAIAAMTGTKTGDDEPTEAKTKDEDVDKAKVMRDIIAIAKQPNEAFKGGAGEKRDTLIKLLDVEGYDDDEAKTNDEDIDKAKLIDQVLGVAMAPEKSFAGGGDEKADAVEKMVEKLGYNESSVKTGDTAAFVNNIRKQVVADVRKEIEEGTKAYLAVRNYTGDFNYQTMDSDEIYRKGLRALGLHIAVDDTKEAFKVASRMVANGGKSSEVATYDSGVDYASMFANIK